MGDVSDMPSRGGSRGHKEEAWLRRHAVQLASQLPERHEDAVRVIEYLMALEVGFLAEGRAYADSALPLCSICSILRSRPEAMPAVLPK